MDRRRTRPQPHSRMGRTIPPRLRRGDGNRRLCDGPCHQSRHSLGDSHHPRRHDRRDHRNRICFCCVARQGTVSGAEHPRLAIRHGLDDLACPGDQWGHTGDVAGAGYTAAGHAHYVGCRAILRGAGVVHPGDVLHAQLASHRARPCLDRGPGEGLRGCGHRRQQLLFQAGGLLDVVIHRRRSPAPS